MRIGTQLFYIMCKDERERERERERKLTMSNVSWHILRNSIESDEIVTEASSQSPSYPAFVVVIVVKSSQ